MRYQIRRRNRRGSTDTAMQRVVVRVPLDRRESFEQERWVIRARRSQGGSRSALSPRLPRRHLCAGADDAGPFTARCARAAARLPQSLGACAGSCLAQELRFADQPGAALRIGRATLGGSCRGGRGAHGHEWNAPDDESCIHSDHLRTDGVSGARRGGPAGRRPGRWIHAGIVPRPAPV